MAIAQIVRGHMTIWAPNGSKDTVKAGGDNMHKGGGVFYIFWCQC